MPRPKSKPALLSESQKNFERLMQYIDALTDAERNAEFVRGTMNRNVRDVLAHIHHWHLMFIEWYEVGMAGKKPAMPAKGYSWKDTPALNEAIFHQYQEEDLPAAQALLTDSYARVREIIERHTDEELFEKKRYPWTGSTSLGAYLVSATSSHYDWAYKLIRKARK